jgi:hypothetical protein
VAQRANAHALNREMAVVAPRLRVVEQSDCVRFRRSERRVNSVHELEFNSRR